MPVEATDPPGRNEPCHCGSGKKYKQCCLGKDEAAQREARAQAGTEGTAPAESAEAKVPPPSPRHKTHQPWKQAANPRGFTRVNVPRRSGGS